MIILNKIVYEEGDSMIKAQPSQSQCTYCNGNGYIQLLLGGSETCVECHGESKWSTGSAKREKKIQIELVHLRLS
jgi:DnaJ-class molecular chaperone